MDAYLLDTNFKKIAYIDVFKSFIWAKRYNEKGALDLECPPSQLYKIGYYIQRTDDESLFRINAIEYKNNEMVIGAEDCTCLLYQRIIWQTVYFSGLAEDFIRQIITENIISPTNENRKINNFFLGEKKGFTDIIDIQTDYETVGEKVEEICQTYNYGFKVVFRDNAFYFELYQSKKSNCVFSPEYDNLGDDTSYKIDYNDYANISLVGGVGDGVARRLESVYIGDTEPNGLNRFEKFLDESSLSIEEETETGELIYRKQLQENGREDLKSLTTSEFEGDVILETYKYKTDFNLGDEVLIKDKYGNESWQQITEITETWDTNGYSLDINFKS